MVVAIVIGPVVAPRYGETCWHVYARAIILPRRDAVTEVMVAGSLRFARPRTGGRKAARHRPPTLGATRGLNRLREQ